MHKAIEIVFNISLMLFMLGNLASMGLQLDIRSALAPLRDMRFVMMSLLAGFVVSPALAYALTLVIPIERSYAIGMLLFGMAPVAPFLPLVVGKARGDLAYAAALMLLAAIGTVIFMPIAVPFLVEGLTASAWSIAKPLLLLVLLPLGIGLLIKNRSEVWTARVLPPVKLITSASTLVFLVVAIILNAKGVLGAVGSYAIGTMTLFVTGMLLVGYLLGGPKREQRSVLSLGMCTRNIGAAAVPLAGSVVDPNTVVMLVIGTFVTVAISMVAAKWLGSRAPVLAATGGTPGITDFG